VPDYEVMPPEEDGKPQRRRRKKPKLPALTIERYGGRLLYVWFGMRFSTLMRLFWRGRFSFTLNCIPDSLALFIWVPWNTLLKWISEWKYGKQAEAVPLGDPPIFVIGHWRSGTTLLHDLFAEDPNLAYPTTWECFQPHHFLLTEGTLDRAFKFLLPQRRPQDDVPVGFDRPQEEEFALIMQGQGSPYLTWAWPRRGPVDTEYLDFKGLPPEKVQSWADAFMWFYRRLKLKHKKRLVMKTPTHAARLKVLTKLFPDARFVFIARNPLDVFPSTVKLWRALCSTQGLHNPPYLEPWLDDYLLDIFERHTQAYAEDRHLIPEENLVEIRYEDLIKDPVGSMRDIYRRLGIDKFDEAEGKMRAFLSDRSDHRVSSYRMPKPLAKKVAERLAPFIDAYGYRAAVDAALRDAPDVETKADLRENAAS